MDDWEPLGTTTQLTRYEAARFALAEAHRIDEVKEVHDKAIALAEYARQARDTEPLRMWTEIRLRAERRAGELLAEMRERGERQKPGDNPQGRNSLAETPLAPTLADLGLTKTQSSKWQGLARLPADKFEIRVEHAKARVAWSSTSAPSSGGGGPYAGENEWHTPPSFVELAREVLGAIDLDPASHVLAQTWIQAARFFTIADDGLKRPWSGRVFLNPPYERALLATFVDKLLTEYASGSVTQAILLTHACVDTGWFHAAARAALSICFARGRIHFVSPSGDVATSRELGRAFFYFGRDDAAFQRKFADVGLIASIRDPPAARWYNERGDE